MPDSVEGLTNIAEYCSYSFAFVYSSTHGMVYIEKLMAAESPSLNPDCKGVKNIIELCTQRSIVLPTILKSDIGW